MKKNHLLFPFLLLTIAILAVFGLVYRYQHSQAFVSSEDNKITIQISPAMMLVPQVIQLNWDAQNINAIYFNGKGVTGTENRQLIAYGQSFDFELTLEDASVRHFSLSPFVLFDSVNISLIALAIFCLFATVSSSFRQSLISRLDMKSPDYWEHNAYFWLRGLLLLIFLATLPVLLFPASLSNPQYSEYGSWLVAITSVLAFFTFILSLVRQKYLALILRLVVQNIPYALTLMLVFAYWSLAYLSLLTSSMGNLGLVHLLIGFAVYAFGLLILGLSQNKQDKAVRFVRPASFLMRCFLALVVLLVWFGIYYLPWLKLFPNEFLHAFFALLLFMLPGILVAIAILPTGTRWHRLGSTGFVFSILAATVLIFVTIAFGFSAAIFQLLFVCFGAGVFLYLLLRRESFELKLMSSSALSFYEICFLSFACISIILVMISSANPDPIHDFQTYNAMISSFAQSPQLSLREPFLATGNLMVSRLWLIAWPASQALVVNFSNLHILQIMDDLNVLLVLLVALAIYDLVIGLQMPRAIACASLIFTAFAIISQYGVDQVGWIFNHRLLHDKTMVAWILTPTLLALVYDYLRYRSRRHAVVLALVAFTVVNCHPTSFFYAALISGIVTSLYVLFISHKWQDIIYVALILGACAILPIILRELGPANYEFEGGVVTRLPDYQRVRLIMNDDMTIVAIALYLRAGLAFALIYVSSFIALLTLRKRPESYYIIAGGLLILAVSNPITAPILARFVTPYHLWRATWFMPFGFAGAFCFWLLHQMLSKKSPQLANLAVLEIAIMLMISIFATTTTRPHDMYIHLEALLDVAESIPASSSNEQFIVLADEDMNEWIPSVRWNLHPILWRETYLQAGITRDEYQTRRHDFNQFFDEGLSLEEMNDLLDKYHIQYIVLEPASNPHLQSLIEANTRIAQVYENGTFRLWRVDTTAESGASDN